MVDQGGTFDEFEVMRHRVSNLYLNWENWRQLFVGDPSKGVLMRSFAPAFFSLVKATLLADVLIAVCKLLDPVTSTARGAIRDNLVLRRLEIQLNSELASDPAARACFDSAMQSLDSLAPSLRQLRNRQLAHEDLKAAIRLEPLPAIEIRQVSQAVESCVRAMEALDKASGVLASFQYRETIALGQAESILESLRLLQHYREIDRTKFNNSLLK